MVIYSVGQRFVWRSSQQVSPQPVCTHDKSINVFNSFHSCRIAQKRSLLTLGYGVRQVLGNTSEINDCHDLKDSRQNNKQTLSEVVAAFLAFQQWPLAELQAQAVAVPWFFFFLINTSSCSEMICFPALNHLQQNYSIWW